MKIVNRLYLKVILIAIILIAAMVGLYFMDKIYKEKLSVQLEQHSKQVSYLKDEILLLEDELNAIDKNKIKSKQIKVTQKDIKSQRLTPKDKPKIDKITKNLKMAIDENSLYKAKISKMNKKLTALQKQLNILDNRLKKSNLSNTSLQATLDKQLKKTKKLLNTMKLEKLQYQKEIMVNIHNQIIQELQYAPYLPVDQLQVMMNQRFKLDNLCFSIYIFDKPKKQIDSIKIFNEKVQSIIQDGRLLEVRIDNRK